MFRFLTAQYDIENKYSLIFLPGRGGKARHFISEYLTEEYCSNCNVFGIQPDEEWYPIPNGASDQEQAVHGLRATCNKLYSFLKEIKKDIQFEFERTIVIGFSAGGVLALELATFHNINFLSLICHNCAILQPEKLPACSIESSILLFHSQDDDCFEWDERYLPMRSALKKQGYKLTTVEKPLGGHRISKNDTLLSHSFIRNKTSTSP